MVLLRCMQNLQVYNFHRKLSLVCGGIEHVQKAYTRVAGIQVTVFMRQGGRKEGRVTHP